MTCLPWTQLSELSISSLMRRRRPNGKGAGSGGEAVGLCLRGKTMKGNRSESTREENHPPSVSLAAYSSSPLYLSEGFGGPQRPSQRKIVLLEAFGLVAHHRVAPYSFSNPGWGGLYCQTLTVRVVRRQQLGKGIPPQMFRMVLSLVYSTTSIFMS